MVNFNKKIINPDKFIYPLSDPSDCPKGIIGIYKIKNTLSGKVYIGQSMDIRKRFLSHIKNISKENNLKLYLAIRKYWIENFILSIILIINVEDRSNDSIKIELNMNEVLYIDSFDSYRNGYNSTPGGDSGRLGYKHTQETIEKMKASAKGRTPTAAKLKMIPVFGYDFLNDAYLYAESASEMKRKTDVGDKSISEICKKIRGRFIASKERFTFSYDKQDLETMIEFYKSGAWKARKFLIQSENGKLNKGKKFKRRGKL